MNYHSAGGIEGATISFTIGQFLFVCAAIAVIAGAVAIIVKLYKWARTPEDKQNAEILALKEHQREQDERMNRFEEYFDRDKREIDSIKEGNVVVQQGILALMNHAINGNDIDKLEDSRDKLEKYLVERWT